MNKAVAGCSSLAVVVSTSLVDEMSREMWGNKMQSEQGGCCDIFIIGGGTRAITRGI